MSDPTIQLGMEVGMPIAPSIRYGRLVGIRRGDGEDTDRNRYVVRLYRRGDGRWPTGEHRALPRPFILPLRGGE